MGSTKTARQCWRKPSTGAAGMAVVLLSGIVATGQDAVRRGNGRVDYPRLPGAVSNAPAWVGADAPFDVARFIEPIPHDKNAAPLYLDALFEFGSDLESCYPEGPERTRRSQAARDRSKRYKDLIEPAYADQKLELDPAAVDAVIKLYAAGYRKLAEAQRLDRCVFETGLGILPLLPHAQVTRQVYRVSSLKLQRDVQRGDLAAAIREIEMVLRLARDLRPRGITMSQLVADAVSQAVYTSMIPTVMASPRLRAEQCERLIKVLEANEAKSVDGYVEGLRAEFISARSTLEDVVHHQNDLGKAMGLKPGQSVVGALLNLAGPGEPAGGGRRTGAEWDAIVARTTIAEEARHVAEMTRSYRNVLALDGLPYAKRLERIRALKAPTGTDPLARIAAFSMQPEALEAVARAGSRTTASLRAMECLLALRRRQISHQGASKDLASLVRGAALKAVPVDPYDGKPFRMGVGEGGEIIIYSVGRDGRDDGGRVDSYRDQKPGGDLIYRLPVIEEKHPLKP
jgi:hypothetical protein